MINPSIKLCKNLFFLQKNLSFGIDFAWGGAVVSCALQLKKFFNFAYFIQKRFILNKLSSIFRNLEIYFAPSAFFLFDSRLNSLQTRKNFVPPHKKILT